MDLRDASAMKAVAELERRAERSDSDLTLYNTYVDAGVLSEVSDRESQVIYGRRGVGKTHLLRFHRHSILLHSERNAYLIIECDKLGSGITSLSNDPAIQARNYFKEFLNELVNQLYDLTETLQLKSSVAIKATTTLVGFLDVMYHADGTFNLRAISTTLTGLIDLLEIERLYIALDEFVSIPQVAQPQFAQILKRTFTSERRIILKIAAVTFQTQLVAQEGGEMIGLEIGADVFSDIDLDGYFLWDENPVGVVLFFSQVLYNHIGESLDWDLTIKPQVKQEMLLSNFFTQEKCFQEMVRACEGNCRDLMNIFRLAYGEFRKGTGNKVSVADVVAAAERWYRAGKLSNLSAQTKDEQFLNHLIQEVIKAKRSRYFMVEYNDVRHPLLLRLINLRLLHRLPTVWFHPDRPGEPYYIFVIDYGCYAVLKNTRSEPHQFVFFDDLEKIKEAGLTDEEAAEIVPLKDRRSIRRIVVGRGALDAFL